MDAEQKDADVSDTSQGEGWWLAADGRWYPPESDPGPATPPPPPAEAVGDDAPPTTIPAAATTTRRDRYAGKPPWWRRRWVIITAAVLVGLIALSAIFGNDESDDTAVATTDDDTETGDDTDPADNDTGTGTNSNDTDGNDTADEAPEATAAPEPTPTPEPTATPEPTPTPTPEPTPTPTPVPFEPIVFSGAGPDVVALDDPITDPLLVTLTHSGSSNFQVSLLDANGERVESLANEIGQWAGTLPVNLRVGDSFAFIEINADGPWEITFDEITSAPAMATEPGSRYDGVGSEVLIFVTDGPAVVAFDCPTCDSNIFISATGDRSDSLENAIGEGGFQGRYVVPDGTFLLQIEARAGFQTPPPPWTLTVD